MSKVRAALIWAALAVAVAVPILVAAGSPYLQYRSWIYVVSGFAGITGLALILLQPLLAGGYLPGVSMRGGRQVHRWIGIGLLAAVAIHVGGLYVTSPPDVIDALLLRSATPFSNWGVLAMVALVAAAGLGLTRRTFKIRPRIWRFAHTALALTVVLGTVVHTLLIQGTMGTLSKAAICVLVVVATVRVLFDLRSWVLLDRLKPGTNRRS